MFFFHYFNSKQTMFCWKYNRASAIWWRTRFQATTISYIQNQPFEVFVMSLHLDSNFSNWNVYIICTNMLSQIQQKEYSWTTGYKKYFGGNAYSSSTALLHQFLIITKLSAKEYLNLAIPQISTLSSQSKPQWEITSCIFWQIREREHRSSIISAYPPRL